MVFRRIITTLPILLFFVSNLCLGEVNSFYVKTKTISNSLMIPGEIVEHKNQFEVKTLVDYKYYESEMKDSIVAVKLSNFYTENSEQWDANVVRIEGPKVYNGDKVIFIYADMGKYFLKNVAKNDRQYKLGDKIDMEFVTKNVESAISVPLEAIFLYKRSKHVMKVINNKVVYFPVETGIEDFTHIHILKGVEVGEELLIAQEKYKDGDLVKDRVVVDPY